MFFCSLCQKPFAHEASRNRHVSYCRRSRDRPRVRHQSCQACSAAKARCTSEPQCSRCRNKGIPCVYDDRIGRHNASGMSTTTILSKPASPQTPVDLPTPTLPQRDESMASSLELAVDELPWDVYLDPLQINHSISVLPQASTAPAMAPLEALSSVEETLPNKFDFLSKIRASPAKTALETSGFLTPLQMSSSAAQCNANYILQMLRPFPQLVVQKSSFPPFIHPFSYNRPTDSQTSIIQEPLANFMGIAQMFVPRTQENSPFVWKTIHNEQGRLLSQVILTMFHPTRQC